MPLVKSIFSDTLKLSENFLRQVQERMRGGILESVYVENSFQGFCYKRSDMGQHLREMWDVTVFFYMLKLSSMGIA